MDHLVPVGPPDIAKVWPAVEPLIDSAYEALDEVTPDVLPWLMEKKGVLWVVFRDGRIIAAATTSLIKARSGLMLRAISCGGSDADWAAHMAQIESYAKAEGCYKVAIDGRRGWGRVLSDYAPKCVSFEKRI